MGSSRGTDWGKGHEVGQRDLRWLGRVLASGGLSLLWSDPGKSEVERLEDLLRRYIGHVCECEGTDFLDDDIYRDRSPINFTDDEWADLKRLSAEALSARPPRGQR